MNRGPCANFALWAQASGPLLLLLVAQEQRVLGGLTGDWGFIERETCRVMRSTEEASLCSTRRASCLRVHFQSSRDALSEVGWKEETFKWLYNLHCERRVDSLQTGALFHHRLLASETLRSVQKASLVVATLARCGFLRHLRAFQKNSCWIVLVHCTSMRTEGRMTTATAENPY